MYIFAKPINERKEKTRNKFMGFQIRTHWNRTKMCSYYLWASIDAFEYEILISPVNKCVMKQIKIDSNVNSLRWNSLLIMTNERTLFVALSQKCMMNTSGIHCWHIKWLLLLNIKHLVDATNCLWFETFSGYFGYFFPTNVGEISDIHISVLILI